MIIKVLKSSQIVKHNTPHKPFDSTYLKIFDHLVVSFQLFLLYERIVASKLQILETLLDREYKELNNSHSSLQSYETDFLPYPHDQILEESLTVYFMLVILN